MTDAEIDALMVDVATARKEHDDWCVEVGAVVISDGLMPRLVDAITTLRAQLAAETDRANRAEAERAAQIDADAVICDGLLGKIWDDEAYDCAAAIRAQPHSRTALDAAIQVAKVEAWRKAEVATLGLATGHECRAAILALIGEGV